MWYPTKQAIDDLLDAVQRQNKRAAFHAVLGPTLEDMPSMQAVLDLLTLAIANTNSTIDTQRQALQEILECRGIENPDIVSARTIKRTIRRFGRKPDDPEDDDDEED